jgi:hypothetical protein
MDEAKTTQLVRQLLPKHGVKSDTVKKIVRPWNAAKNTKTIILLTDLADESRRLRPAAHRAGSKPTKTSGLLGRPAPRLPRRRHRPGVLRAEPPPRLDRSRRSPAGLIDHHVALCVL